MDETTTTGSGLTPTDSISAVSVSGGTVATLTSVCKHCNGEGRVQVEGRRYYRDPGDVVEVECGFCDGSGIGAEAQS